MGADIIIGVDVQDDLKNRNSLNEATQVLLQISNLQVMKGMKDKIANTDIYIKPDISNYTVISFDKKNEIINKGEEAALKVLDKIKNLSQNHKPLQVNTLQNKCIIITNVVFNDLNEG